MTHAHFARIGGFVRSNQGDIATQPVAVARDKSVGVETVVELGLARNNALQGHRLAIKEISVSGWESPSQSAAGHASGVTARTAAETSASPPPNPYHLTTTDILNLQRHGQLPKLPRFTYSKKKSTTKANPMPSPKLSPSHKYSGQ
jgi:hypothetical protein